jgi:hypothetical protein
MVLGALAKNNTSLRESFNVFLQFFGQRKSPTCHLALKFVSMNSHSVSLVSTASHDGNKTTSSFTCTTTHKDFILKDFITPKGKKTVQLNQSQSPVKSTHKDKNGPAKSEDPNLSRDRTNHLGPLENQILNKSGIRSLPALDQAGQERSNWIRQGHLRR